MRAQAILSTAGLLALYAQGAAGGLVSNDRIKVFLFAAPAFWQEVAVDAYKNVCIDLDNNLIDGRVQSILIGGHSVPEVMSRDDSWYCTFYDNYDCIGDVNGTMIFSAGVNNLRSVGWQKKIHALMCQIENV
ncbi:hypothetical protein B0J11DRAFT_428007 [Dendryphion nanum]|uniref:Uncharacterized protein n=1 Tax=Dendryphion nanum TaxID=256645 RepID=A0A9P9E6T9_9PLEO|nr:hypothetical protein B0J11DRAFT_428007 [Dendryphion nanum]